MNSEFVFLVNDKGRLLLDGLKCRLSGTNKNGISVIVYRKNGYYKACYNLIRSDGTPVFPYALDMVKELDNGYYQVKRMSDSKYNCVSDKGEVVSNEWYKCVYEFNLNNLLKVEKDNGLVNFIDVKTGDPISTRWFNAANYFMCNTTRVSVQDRDGRILYNYLRSDGTIVFDEDLVSAGSFENCDGLYIARVLSENSCNFLNGDGNLVSSEWFAYGGEFIDGFAAVCRKSDHMWNFISPRGKYLSERWFNNVTCFSKDGMASAKIGDKWYHIDSNGKLYD